MSRPSRLVIVTATTNRARAQAAIDSWGDHETIVVENGGAAASPYLGTVPAFRRGVDQALVETDAEVIACLHDDLEIHERDWAAKVLRYVDRIPAIGLMGFGGAKGLGSDELYRTPYDPMQLARVGFRSDLVDAEAHGARSLLAERVACLDGFSQIGRRAFFAGETRDGGRIGRPWTALEQLGFIHHFYDSALGCLAARAGWETWYVPVRATHRGGQTAVGDPGYQRWAAEQTAGGDQGFWAAAHRIGYEEFRDQLPLRV